MKLKEMRLLYEDKKDRYWRNEIANSKGNIAEAVEHSIAPLAKHVSVRRVIILLMNSRHFLLTRLHQCVRLLLRCHCMTSLQVNSAAYRMDRGNG